MVFHEPYYLVVVVSKLLGAAFGFVAIRNDESILFQRWCMNSDARLRLPDRDLPSSNRNSGAELPCSEGSSAEFVAHGGKSLGASAARLGKLGRCCCLNCELITVGPGVETPECFKFLLRSEQREKEQRVKEQKEKRNHSTKKQRRQPTTPLLR